MTENNPVVILDDDEEVVQTAGVAVRANIRSNSGPVCPSEGPLRASPPAVRFNRDSLLAAPLAAPLLSSGDAVPPHPSRNSPGRNHNNLQQAEIDGQSQGSTVLFTLNTSDWIRNITKDSNCLLLNSSNPFPAESLPPFIALQQKQTGPSAIAEEKGLASSQPESSKPYTISPFAREFFTDMARTIGCVFPYGEFAEKYNCTVDQVNIALSAVVLEPLMKSDGVTNDDLGVMEIELEQGPGMDKISDSYLGKKWLKQYNTAVPESQRETPAEAFPQDFEETLFAAFGELDAYWKAKNIGLKIYKAFEDAMIVARKEAENQALAEQQLGSVVNWAKLQALQQQPSTMTKTTIPSALPMQEQKCGKGHCATPSRKRARSSSDETGEEEDTSGASSNNPTPSTSPPTFLQLSPPAKKKAKLTATQPTPTYHIAQYIDLTSDHHTAPCNEIHNLDGLSGIGNGNINIPGSLTIPYLSVSAYPITQQPTSLPGYLYVPAATTNLEPKPNPNSSNLPFYFIRPGSRLDVTVDDYGKCQPEVYTGAEIPKHEYGGVLEGIPVDNNECGWKSPPEIYRERFLRLSNNHSAPADAEDPTSSVSSNELRDKAASEVKTPKIQKNWRDYMPSSGIFECYARALEEERVHKWSDEQYEKRIEDRYLAVSGKVGKYIEMLEAQRMEDVLRLAMEAAVNQEGKESENAGTTLAPMEPDVQMSEAARDGNDRESDGEEDDGDGEEGEEEEEDDDDDEDEEEEEEDDDDDDDDEGDDEEDREQEDELTKMIREHLRDTDEWYRQLAENVDDDGGYRVGQTTYPAEEVKQKGQKGELKEEGLEIEQEDTQECEQDDDEDEEQDDDREEDFVP
ncbi:hypothetical protein PAAG_04912 [Paracoccidioides lutzii Pb01]|uniref:Uncharacterized protein n=1 Tax=Paracoccidioides lutzii (strain ATCC MYA-826 / Pb01) TaxID=502779 RepID=C1H1X6_PARBA|nr:hypothetical protein PAAG_04912 [Paracoccidioides lutzii Pb01]EEH33863.1 hypothetical protein PAAG_04912 [Paracoccidioides lutzii Pb01]